MTPSLTRLLEEAVRFLWSASPTLATAIGVHDYDDRLIDWDPGAIEDRLRAFSSHREAIARSVERTPSQTPDDALDARLLLDHLEIERRLLSEVRLPFRDPGVYLEEILHGVYCLAQRDFAPLPERAHRVALRLREAPRLLQQGIRNLADPSVVPALWVGAALEQVQGSAEFLARLEEELVPVAGAAAGDLRRAVGEALHAMGRFTDHLRGRLGPRARGPFAIGSDLYDFLLKAQHGLEFDAQSLGDFGRDLVALAEKRLKEAAERIDPGRTWRDLVIDWKEDHPRAQDFLTDYRKEVEKVRDFVKRRDLVTFPQGERLLVVETPAFQRALCPFAAYVAPAAFESERAGIFWVTPPDPKAPPEAQERHLQDHMRPAMPGTTAHEAYPGHHLQLSIAARVESKVRRTLSTSVLVEGWAFYCEQLMAEEGYYDDPRSRALQLKDQLWRSCRVVLDVGLQTGGMKVEEAVAMLRDVACLEEASARGEVIRYTRTPTQPMSYAAGKHAILELREEVRARRGAAFSLREFHDRFLSYGSIPIARIRERLLQAEGIGTAARTDS